MATEIPATSWWHDREELGVFARTFDRSTKLKLKQSKCWGITPALKTFATTIGHVVYIPAEWSTEAVRRVIPHEVAGHVKQFRYAGLGIHPSVGVFPGMFIAYLLVFFPVLLAWGRYRLELHADTKSWEYHLRQKVCGPSEIRARADHFASTISGPAYAWCWPKPWALWGFRRRAEKVITKISLELPA
jgi:hypothetical protein